MNITGPEITAGKAAAYAIANVLDTPGIITDVEGCIHARTAVPPAGFGGAAPCDCAFDRLTESGRRSALQSIEDSGADGAHVTLDFVEIGPRDYYIYKCDVGECPLFIWQDRETRERNRTMIESGGTHLRVIGGIANEARDPLHSILGYTECLLNSSVDTLSGRQRDYCTKIQKAGHRLAWLFEQLADISRLESGDITLNVEPVHVDDIVENAMMASEEAAQAKKIEITPDIPDDVLPTMFVDGRRIVLVLRNLLDYAIRSAKPGASIVFGVRVHKCDVYFLICDHNPSDHEQHAGTNDPGSDIQLSVSERIIEMHRGELSRQSSKEGRIFIVRVPAVPGSDDIACGSDPTANRASDC